VRVGSTVHRQPGQRGDVWDYAFDGASSSFMNTQLYGPRLSCVAAPMCVAVEIDMVNVGR